MGQIPTSIQFLGLSFHVYGLIIGISLIIGLWLAERVVVAAGYTAAVFWKLAAFVIVGGLLGARAWHVMTDWPLYADRVIYAFYVWEGGLSIVGAVIGGGLAGILASRFFRTRSSLPIPVFFDAMALSLPFAQAMGRLGNWVNQELFGLPSTLPWAIFISEEHRPAVVRHVSHFHPLFAYEALLMIAVGGLLWWLYKLQKLQVGTGYLFGLYIFLYSVIRFFLDFLRLEKAVVSNLGLGFNQIFLVAVAVLSGGWLWWNFRQQRRLHKQVHQDG